MNNFLFDASNLNNILSALNEHLSFSQCPLTELVVCGGSALNALGLIERTTRDIDVLALMRHGELVKCIKFPDYLNQAIAKVAEDFNLPEGWINSGPASLIDFGPPEGFIKRLHPVNYGKFLKIYFIDRIDQIYFKLYAATDHGPASRHFQDLVKLEPKSDEISGAAAWLLEQDASVEFRNELRQCLLIMGFKDAAGRI